VNDIEDTSDVEQDDIRDEDFQPPNDYERDSDESMSVEITGVKCNNHGVFAIFTPHTVYMKALDGIVCG